MTQSIETKKPRPQGAAKSVPAKAGAEAAAPKTIAPAGSRFSSRDVTGAIKFGIHCTMVVTERIISAIMAGYRKLFVVDVKVRGGFYKEEGLKAYQKHDYEAAVKNLEQSVEEEEEEDVEVLYHLGMAHAYLEEYETAVDILKKAEKIEPDDADTVAEIADCLIRLERYAEAVEYCEKAVQLTPDAASNHYLLGTAYEKTGKLEEATRTYKKCIEMDPRDPVYYHALGFAYESAGKHNDAIGCFKKAMELEKKR
ncbi:MAG: tetratricopeptide repeat protein [Candidatus Omnitrophica bacterium]|nr:tetratricopeptide repeat protein [Candidatus Omnitrophota bacterium]